MAFVTGESSRRIPRIPGEKEGEDGEGHLNVFVPTTPNPTSGFLVFFKKSDVIPLDMSVEDGLKLVISGGILEPGVPAPGEPPPPAKSE
jgi:uncharacterized membrane protein